MDDISDEKSSVCSGQQPSLGAQEFVVTCTPVDKYAQVKLMVQEYYEMVRWRLIELVPKVIVHHMVRHLSDSLTRELGLRLASRADDELVLLFREAEPIMREREQVAAQLKNCERALGDLEKIELEYYTDSL